jgi:hypothetical protein
VIKINSTGKGFEAVAIGKANLIVTRAKTATGLYQKPIPRKYKPTIRAKPGSLLI